MSKEIVDKLEEIKQAIIELNPKEEQLSEQEKEELQNKRLTPSRQIKKVPLWDWSLL